MDDTLFDSVISRAGFLQGVYRNKMSQKDKLDSEVAKLRDEKDILDKSEKVIKLLLDKLVKNDLSSMDALVSYGLKTVYADRDVSFKSEIVDYGKKIQIDLQTISEGKKVDPQSQSSVHVIESFLLRLICIIKMKKAKFLLLDETFAAVDPGYIENFSQLIVQLCGKLGMDMLLVTHNMGFTDFANHSYRLSRVEDKTGITQIK